MILNIRKSSAKPANNGGEKLKVSSKKKTLSLGAKQNKDAFSTAKELTKFVNITVDCMRYDDSKLESPLSESFDLARDYNYTDIVYVLDKDISKSDISYTSVFTVLSEKFIEGLNVATVEAADLPKEDKLDKIPYVICEILGKQTTKAVAMNLENYTVESFLSNKKVNCLNPLKRKILVMFDNSFIGVANDVAAKIMDELISLYSEQLKRAIYADTKSVHSTYVYYNSYEDYKNRTFNIINPSDTVGFASQDSDDFDDFKLPNGKSFYTSIDIMPLDSLIEMHYLNKITIEDYYGVTNKQRKEVSFEEREKEINDYLNKADTADTKDALSIKKYTKQKLAAICEDNQKYILISYDTKANDERKFFLFPDKILTNEEFESVSAESTEKAESSEDNKAESAEVLAKLEPKNDQEVIEKMMMFEDYSDLVFNGNNNDKDGFENELTFSRFYGKSYYDICMESWRRQHQRGLQRDS